MATDNGSNENENEIHTNSSNENQSQNASTKEIVQVPEIIEEEAQEENESIDQDNITNDNDDGRINSSIEAVSTNSSTLNNNNNNQRLNLDILSTISNQSEIDAEENDEDQNLIVLASMPEDNNSTTKNITVENCKTIESDATPALDSFSSDVLEQKPKQSSTSPLSTSSTSRNNILNIDFPSSSSSSSNFNEVINKRKNHHNTELTNKNAVQQINEDTIVPKLTINHLGEASCIDIAWSNNVSNGMDLDSEEEICTCRDNTEDESLVSSEDELPSRDVDLSGYTQSDPISEELLNDRITETPKNHRKRKITECRSTPTNDGKRAMFSPRAIFSQSSPNLSSISTPTSHSEKKTPRSVIPTKDNPPPELSEWLLQFQKWSNAERLLAVDRLIEHCEPTQVRYMMKIIEPQFQRDFISLLPRELALQVLSYLEPKDLLRAAQTCRSWRYLADDNLLWKEKCKQVGILDEMKPDSKPIRRGRVGNMPVMASPWKACYVRHHTIEMNWRSRLIRCPKVLKGHDDHVITCLQFCGNRIVSGSDDNTLKVWSAVTGKVKSIFTFNFKHKIQFF